MTQLKNKQRVADHGEVFTSERDVNAMLDLVEQETLRVESRFLEPACGTGNFLAEILRRKLIVVSKRYKNSRLEFERFSVLAISSIYGIDILEDNVAECRSRLFRIFEEEYKYLYNDKCNPDCLKTAKYILTKNILWGDALSLKAVGENDDPIIFSEWSPVNRNMIKRRDYTLSILLDYQPMEGDNLFSDLGDQAFIPKPIKEYPLIHFLELPCHA
jgi:hypothetical protein